MTAYDAIVLGARVAGSPTAMLLARKGYRVLLVDRATFPSDTMSTHLIHAPGMAALDRWGLANQIIATGCPPVHTYRLDLGPLAVVGSPRVEPGKPPAHAPRRLELDSILVEAAAHAGADVREGFSVESLIVEDGVVRGIRGHGDGGALAEERARVVVGADGVNSLVAKTMNADAYNEVPAGQAMYYGYWSGMPADGEWQLYIRGTRAIVTVPTNEDLSIVLVAWPMAEFETNKHDLEAAYVASFEADPEIKERIARATRESRIVGKRMDNFYRVPYGPGWVLAGDAGYHKDAGTAQGITDSLHQAEMVADALDDVFGGRRSFDEALGAYQETRDRTTLPMYQMTCEQASWEEPSPEQQQLMLALSQSKEGADDFMSVMAGSLAVEGFFDPANLARYFDPAAAS